MKSHYSKVIYSEDTLKKAEKLKELKRRAKSFKGSPIQAEHLKQEMEKFIHETSMEEMEVIAAIVRRENNEEHSNIRA